MRYAFVGDLPDWIDYKNIRHGHSHIALLGWLYAGLYIFIVYLFELKGVIYSRLFWLNQFSVLGMLIFFPLFGYAGISIFFVSLFIFLTYAFIYLVFKDLPRKSSGFSHFLLKTSLFFLFISSLGTWALGLISVFSMRGTALYYAAIQFYLHFQFNGWLVFGVLALFFKILSRRNIKYSKLDAQLFFRLLFVSTLLTYALAISWSTPIDYIFWINGLGVLIQLASLIYLFKIIKEIVPKLKSIWSRDMMILLSISLLSFCIKVIIQTLVVIPYFATVSYTIRNFVIGFIHLLMLGCLSSFIIAMSHQFFERNKKFSIGIKIFVFAVVISELILFLQGLLIWLELGFMQYYYASIFLVSIFIPLGLFIYLMRLVREDKGIG